MGGRYGGDIRRGRGKSPWRVSRDVLAAIGRATRPDLEKVGRRTRYLAKIASDTGTGPRTEDA